MTLKLWPHDDNDFVSNYLSDWNLGTLHISYIFKGHKLVTRQASISA